MLSRGHRLLAEERLVVVGGDDGKKATREVLRTLLATVAVAGEWW